MTTLLILFQGGGRGFLEPLIFLAVIVIVVMILINRFSKNSRVGDKQQTGVDGGDWRSWRSKTDDQIADAARQLSDYTEEGQRIIREELHFRGMPDPPATQRPIDESRAPVSNEGLRKHRVDEHINAVDGDYLVIPFIGKIKSGFLSSENAETVSRQLESLINQYSQRGWEFHNIAKVDIEVTPGCLASLFGAKTSFITFDQVVFRRSGP
jgi:hypothetical protein